MERQKNFTAHKPIAFCSAKAEQNADILEREKINISELFEIIAEQQQEIAKEKGLDFSYSVENSIFSMATPRFWQAL